MRPPIARYKIDECNINIIIYILCGVILSEDDKLSLEAIRRAIDELNHKIVSHLKGKLYSRMFM